MSKPISLCHFFPETPTQSFVTTRFGSSEQGQILSGMFPERVVRMNQTHSANVTCYRPMQGPDLGWEEDIPNKRPKTIDLEGGICVPDTDALWTAETDTLLLVKTADCLPLSFYHPSGIIGVIHAGRKGLNTGIIGHTFREVCEAIDAPKKYDIQLKKNKTTRQIPFSIHYGPSICVRCYQINKDINLHMDLRQHATAQVHEALKGYSFTESYSPFCTSCHNSLFFSYRKGDAVDRLYSGIMQPS